MSDIIDIQPKKEDNLIQNKINNYQLNKNKIENNQNNKINKYENKNDLMKNLCSQYTNGYYNCMEELNDFRVCVIHFDNMIKCQVIQEQHRFQGSNP